MNAVLTNEEKTVNAGKPLTNEDLSDKPGERLIDKPELPPTGISNGNDLWTETVEIGRAHV